MHHSDHKKKKQMEDRKEGRRKRGKDEAGKRKTGRRRKMLRETIWMKMKRSLIDQKWLLEKMKQSSF